MPAQLPVSASNVPVLMNRPLSRVRFKGGKEATVMTYRRPNSLNQVKVKRYCNVRRLPDGARSG